MGSECEITMKIVPSFTRLRNISIDALAVRLPSKLYDYNFNLATLKT